MVDRYEESFGPAEPIPDDGVQLSQPSLRRVRSATTRSMVVGVSVFWAVALVAALDPLWHLAVLAPSIVVSFLVVVRWRNPGAPLLSWSLGVGGATAVIGSWLAVSPLATGGLLIAGAAGSAHLRRHRGVSAAGVLAAAVGAALLSAVEHPQETALYVLSAVCFGVFWIAIFWGTQWSWRVTLQLDDAHRAQTELSIYRERFRFAADLHDIQGHTLHVVKLKTALAQRLMGTSLEAARKELDQVSELVTDTISQARSLAYGDRKLTIRGELANAQRLLEAAGAVVEVDITGQMPPAREEQASLVLREATTNILRHSQATHVEMSVTPQLVRVTNDGVLSDLTTYSGLRTLGQRIQEAGGELTAHRLEDRFVTELRLPAEMEKVP